MLKSRASSLTLLLAVLWVVPTTTHAQIWWNTSESSVESGKLSEIKDKRKVYLNIVYRTVDGETVSSQQEQLQIQNSVAAAIGAYKGLELVVIPERADMVINITASVASGPQAAPAPVLGNFSLNRDADLQFPLEMVVVVPGKAERNRTPRPRSVWSMSSSNVHSEPAPTALRWVEGFISELKKLRGEKE